MRSTWADAKLSAQPIPEMLPIRFAWHVAVCQLASGIQLTSQTQRVDEKRSGRGARKATSFRISKGLGGCHVFAIRQRAHAAQVRHQVRSIVARGRDLLLDVVAAQRP